MLIEKNFFNLLYLGSKYKQAARPLVYHPIQMQDVLSAYSERRTVRKTKDLIKALLGHGARASRNSQPRTHVGISVFTPDGGKAVRLRMTK